MMHCRKTYSAARDCSTKAAILSTWISATARPVSYTRRSWAGSRSMERDPAQLRRVYDTGRAVAEIQVDKIAAFVEQSRAAE